MNKFRKIIRNKKVYLTFDVDGLDSSIMPATGTPEPGGLFWDETMKIIKIEKKVSFEDGRKSISMEPNKISLDIDFEIVSPTSGIPSEYIKRSKGIDVLACIALTNLLTRKYFHLSTSFSAAFFSMIVSVIAFLIAMKFSFVPMSASDIFLSMFGGVLAGLGISAIIYGSRMLPASIYGMTSYFQLIYGVVLGWLVFQQLPTTFNYIGIIFVFSAGIILFTFDKNKS